MQFTKYQKRAAAWVLIAAVAGLMVWLLAPVLMPFVVAWVLAYVLNPLVDRIDAWFKGRMPRWLSVGVVEVVVILALIGVFMLVVPLFIKQAPEMGRQLPALFDKARLWLESTAARYGFDISLDVGTISEWVSEYFQADAEAGAGPAAGAPSKSVVHSLLSSLVIGGNVALSILGNLTLIPLALYYLLLDWKRFNESLYSLVPLRMRETVVGFLREADEVLGQYLRGQMLVMSIMALFYSVGLMLFGLDLAWPIGIFTGLALFIPYIGFAVGMVMAALVGIMQLGFSKAAIMVAVVFGIGQFLESFFLTPRLVGERIGLHPLMVIFALLAFGQLFGFVGVLIALPTSAVLLVAIRRLRQQYFASSLYKDKG
ncbi:MAG: AI-2E family transporter [Brachymonas sp.]|nr:AI-2E family transporter [Brachymonas sp.]